MIRGGRNAQILYSSESEASSASLELKYKSIDLIQYENTSKNHKTEWERLKPHTYFVYW